MSETKKAMEHESDGNISCNWCTWNDPQMFSKGLERLKIGEQTETIKTTALLRSIRILRRVLET